MICPDNHSGRPLRRISRSVVPAGNGFRKSVHVDRLLNRPADTANWRHSLDDAIVVEQYKSVVVMLCTHSKRDPYPPGDINSVQQSAGMNGCDVP